MPYFQGHKTSRKKDPKNSVTTRKGLKPVSIGKENLKIGLQERKKTKHFNA